MLQHLSAQIVCLSPKVWNFDEKRLHWASIVRVFLPLDLDIVTCSSHEFATMTKKVTVI